MEITVNRRGAGKNKDDRSTVGIMTVDDVMVYTLEDDFDETKEWGHTRIPAGRYEVKFRKTGGHHKKYASRFPAMHKGMLHITNVPNYEYILIHCGKTSKSTAGFIVVGMTHVSDDFIGRITEAYELIYPKIASALESGEQVFINIID